MADTQRFVSSAIRDLLEQARQPGVISLAGGLPADELIPVERLGVAWSTMLDEHGAAAFQYGPSAGEPALIDALATIERVDPQHTVITAGSQQALDLVASVLENPSGVGNLAAVEHPGYVGALQILRARRYELLPIPVDSDGIDVGHLADLLAAGARPNLCYVNPSFQNPTGASLTAERGAELIRLAEHYGFVVVSDDPYAELGFECARTFPMPDSDRLVKLGSMSKTLSPGLRIGWLTAPANLTADVVLAKQAADLHTSTSNQLVTAATLRDERWWSAHCEGLRSTYRTRRDALVASLERHIPHARFTPQTGGFFLWIPLVGSKADAHELASRALAEGVAIVPGDAFSADDAAPPRAIRLSYSSPSIADMDVAVQRLARVFDMPTL